MYRHALGTSGRDFSVHTMCVDLLDQELSRIDAVMRNEGFDARSVMQETMDITQIETVHTKRHATVNTTYWSSDGPCASPEWTGTIPLVHAVRLSVF